MKSSGLVFILLGILLIASCKKSSTSASVTSWSFGATKYNATSVTFSSSDSSLDAVSSDGSLSLYFPSRSVTSGTYLIVNYDSVPLHSGTMYIRFIDSGTSQYYFSTGSDSIRAQVTVSPTGQINVSVPAVYLESYANPIPYSTQLTATIHQL